MIDPKNLPEFDRGSLLYQQMWDEGTCLACHAVQEMPGEGAALGVCESCGSASVMSGELLLALADKLETVMEGSPL
jgi:hypothetical protein